MPIEDAQQNPNGGGRDLTPEEERKMDHIVVAHGLYSRRCLACAGFGCPTCSGMGELFFLALNQPCGPFCPLTFRAN